MCYVDNPHITRPKGGKCYPHFETCQDGQLLHLPSGAGTTFCPECTLPARDHPPRCRATLSLWSSLASHAVTPTPRPDPRGHILAHVPSHASNPCTPTFLLRVDIHLMLHHGIAWGPWPASAHRGEPISLDGQDLNLVFKAPPSSGGSSFCL
jgi:hypothetical protein